MSDEVVDELVAKLNSLKSDKKSGVSLSSAAAAKVKELLSKESEKYDGLRVRVQPGGCSGFVYQLSFDNTVADDVIIEKDGIKLILDKESVSMLDGAEVDFVDGLNGSGFKINNPNAKSNCGCGKSFS